MSAARCLQRPERKKRFTFCLHPKRILSIFYNAAPCPPAGCKMELLAPGNCGLIVLIGGGGGGGEKGGGAGVRGRAGVGAEEKRKGARGQKVGEKGGGATNRGKERGARRGKRGGPNRREPFGRQAVPVKPDDYANAPIIVGIPDSASPCSTMRLNTFRKEKQRK